MQACKTFPIDSIYSLDKADTIKGTREEESKDLQNVSDRFKSESFGILFTALDSN